jgi:hypothetical protein
MTPRLRVRSREVEGVSSGLKLLWRDHNPLGLLTLSRRAWMAWGKPVGVFLLHVLCFDWTCVSIANALGFASSRLTLSYFWPTLGIVDTRRMRKRFSPRGRCSPCTGAGCRRCAGCAVETGRGSRYLIGPNASRDGNIGLPRARRRERRIPCRRWNT